MSDIVITFETLYDLLRREKNKEEIQHLDLSFFEDVLAYLAEKQALLATKTDDDLFTIGEREKIETELRNIKKILRELYERREKKVIDLALNKSRTASSIIQTTTLLPGEHALFNNLVTTLDAWREQTLGNLFSGQHPTTPTHATTPTPPPSSTTTRPAAPPTPNKPTTPTTTQPTRPTKPTHPTPTGAPTPATPSPPPTKDQPNPQIALTITHPVPQFLGEHLETFGPYQNGDVAHLPERLANILLTKKRAEPLLNTPLTQE